LNETDRPRLSLAVVSGDASCARKHKVSVLRRADVRERWVERFIERIKRNTKVTMIATLSYGNRIECPQNYEF
jgi:hypothetical protein